MHLRSRSLLFGLKMTHWCGIFTGRTSKPPLTSFTWNNWFSSELSHFLNWIGPLLVYQQFPLSFEINTLVELTCFLCQKVFSYPGSRFITTKNFLCFEGTSVPSNSWTWTLKFSPKASSPWQTLSSKSPWDMQVRVFQYSVSPASLFCESLVHVSVYRLPLKYSFSSSWHNASFVFSQNVWNLTFGGDWKERKERKNRKKEKIEKKCEKM